MSDNDKVMVSIYCLAYNHEQYIRDALEGFVNQVTDFKYEVIIHDDASTDGTASIIKEYEEKYPDIIKPVYQKENQYSQGIDILETFLFRKMSGKYIAICEGDDYWCCNDKLQKQVDFMEKNPKFAGCAHSSYIENLLTNTKTIYNYSESDYSFEFIDILLWSNKRFQTSSILLKKEYLLIPDKLTINRIGDYPRAVNLMLNGGIYYMKDIMSVYRAFTPASWSINNETCKEKKIMVHNAKLKFLDNLDEYTNGVYNREIEIVRRNFEYDLLIEQEKYKIIVQKYKDILKKLNKKERIKVYIKRYFNFAYKLYRKMKR